MVPFDAVAEASAPPEKKLFPSIGPHAFEHPLDRTALMALQKVPGLDWLIKNVVAAIGDKRLRLFFLASAVRVDERQFPRVHRAYLEACRVLDVREPPELFVTQRMAVNAAAIGLGKPIVVVTGPLLEMLDDRELQCVLGHELGHVLCGHARYTTLVLLLLNAWNAFSGIPGGMLAIQLIRMALLEWSRKAELSADRAGLLVAQDPSVCYRVDMKLAGGLRGSEMNLEAFLAQAEEYRQAGDLLDGVLKISLLLDQTHPLPALRVAELSTWVESGDYQRILDGTYERRGAAPERDLTDSARSAAAGYKEAIALAFEELSSGAQATGQQLLELLRHATRGPESSGQPSEKVPEADKKTPGPKRTL